MNGANARRVAFSMFVALAGGVGCAAESIMIELRPDESVVKMAVSGETLAIGVASSEPYDPRKGIQEQSSLVLLSEGAPIVRTSLGLGFLRDLVSTTKGFVALLVRNPGLPAAVAQVFLVDRGGKVTELAPLSLDPLGVWLDAAGDIHAYSGRVVMRWSAAAGAWSRVTLDPMIAAAAPITRIVGLNGGRAALINARSIIGFTRLEDPPVFSRDMGAYPNPLKLFGARDQWWLVVSTESEQQLVQVAADGGMREVMKLRGEHVQNLMFNGERVIVACSGEGRNVHKGSYYVLEGAGGRAIRGPRKLPDDTMRTCLWRGSIVSGGAGRRVFKTSIAR